MEDDTKRKRHPLHNAALLLFLLGAIAIIVALIVPEPAVPGRTDIILGLLGTGFLSLVGGALFSGIGSHLLTLKEKTND